MTYTPRILTETADMNGVRYAAQMTEFDLSDDNILSPVLLPAVESEIANDFPSWESTLGNDRHLLRAAVTNFVAARAIQREMEKERGMEYSYTRLRQELIENLMNQAAGDLCRIDAFEDEIMKMIVSNLFVAYGPEQKRRAEGEWMGEGSVIHT